MHIVVPAKDHATTQSQVGDVSDFSVIACTVYRDRSTFTPARSLSNSRSAGTCTPPSLSSSSSPASWPWQVRCRRKQRLRRTRSLFQACAAKYPAARLPVRDWSKAVKGFVNFCAVLQCADLNQMTFDLWVVVDGSWAVDSCSQSEKIKRRLRSWPESEVQFVWWSWKRGPGWWTAICRICAASVCRICVASVCRICVATPVLRCWPPRPHFDHRLFVCCLSWVCAVAQVERRASSNCTLCCIPHTLLWHCQPRRLATPFGCLHEYRLTFYYRVLLMSRADESNRSFVSASVVAYVTSLGKTILKRLFARQSCWPTPLL